MATGLIAAGVIKLGDNADTSKNFVIKTPPVADGSLSIQRENGTHVLDIDVNGFMSVSSGPSLKFKKITGTTAALAASEVVIPHGLPSGAKILGITFSVQISASTFISSGSYQDAYAFGWFHNDTNINLRNGPTNTNGLSKAFVALITYEA